MRPGPLSSVPSRHLAGARPRAAAPATADGGTPSMRAELASSLTWPAPPMSAVLPGRPGVRRVHLRIHRPPQGDRLCPTRRWSTCRWPCGRSIVLTPQTGPSMVLPPLRRLALRSGHCLDRGRPAWFCRPRRTSAWALSFATSSSRHAVTVATLYSDGLAHRTRTGRPRPSTLDRQRRRGPQWCAGRSAGDPRSAGTEPLWAR